MNVVKRFGTTCSVLALGLSVTLYAQGQRTPPSEKTPPPPPAKMEPAPANKASMGDASFLKEAAQDNMAEVELAKLAETNASDARLKTFAQQLQKDHEQAGSELMSIAQQKNVKLPTDISTGSKMSKNSLSKKHGVDFDKAWVDQIVKAHNDAVKDFEGATKSKDAQIKAFAEKTLPTLREHLAKAQDLKKSMGAGH